MTQVTLRTTTKRETFIVDSTKTLREIFEEHSVDYSRANILVNGSSVSRDKLDNSLESLGASETCDISAIVKADNA